MKDYLDRLLSLRMELSNLLHEMSDDAYVHPEALKQFSRYGVAGMNALQDAATLCWCIGTGLPTHAHLARGGFDIHPGTYHLKTDSTDDF
jgi:hypothetical protein